MEQKTFQTKALELYNPNKHNEKAIFEFAIDGETKTELLETVCAAPESQDILVHFITPKLYAKGFRTKSTDHSWKIVAKSIVYYAQQINGRTHSDPEVGQGWEVFFPKRLFSILNKKSKVLVITECPFSAGFMCSCGIPAAAMPMLEDWKKFQNNDIYKSLIEAIEGTGIERIVLLTNSDSCSIEYRDNIDLYDKPHTIYYAIERMKNATRETSLEVSWAYLHPDFGYKTPFDFFNFINDTKKDLELFQSEISKKSGPKGYIVKHDVSRMGLNQIKELLGIHRGGAEFFEFHKATIGLDPFIFKKQVYQYNHESDRAEFVRSEEAHNFINVGGVYFIKNVGIDDFGNVYPRTDKFPMGAFEAKFPTFSNDQLKRMRKDIPYFDLYDTRPEHINYLYNWNYTDPETNFETKYYNTYHPIYHRPKQGKCDLSIAFVKHIFGTDTIIHKGQPIEQWELGLDYIKLLYENPKELLPILCLVSEVQKTGKSSFPEWMQAIFQMNVVKVPATDISSRFTGFWAGKLLLYIEEALISKAHDVETLKDLVTSPTQKLELKGVDSVTVKNFTKVIITSNRERSFAPIKDDDVRFWVRKLNPIPGGPVYDFKTKLYNEIPAFLYYLQERPMVTTWEDRGWFNINLIRTEALDAIRSTSSNYSLKTIKEAIVDYMTKAKVRWCKLSKGDIVDLVDDREITKSRLSYYIETEMGKTLSKSSNKYVKYKFAFTHEDQPEVTKLAGNSFYYTFTASDFMDTDLILSEDMTGESDKLTSLEALAEMEEHENSCKKTIATRISIDQIIDITRHQLDQQDVKKSWESLEYKSIKALYMMFADKLNGVPF